MRRRLLLVPMALGIAALACAAWQFFPPALPALSLDRPLRYAAWLGVEWSMEPASDAAIQALADQLTRQQITDIFVYTSYLKPDNTFNPTYDHAPAFTARLRDVAPQIRILSWIGVPVQVTTPDGIHHDNRLEDAQIRAQIARFARRTITEMGFDGLHLNAELIADGDAAYLDTLAAIRGQLPGGAFLSVAPHALKLPSPGTLVPYPAISHHWSASYLRRVAQNVDQVAIMGYDSGLFLPSDYRAWVAHQVVAAAQALDGLNTEVFIGLSASAEWTPSHQTQAENLYTGLYGLQAGLSRLAVGRRIDGIALYAYWEMDDAAWRNILALNN